MLSSLDTTRQLLPKLLLMISTMLTLGELMMMLDMFVELVNVAGVVALQADFSEVADTEILFKDQTLIYSVRVASR